MHARINDNLKIVRPGSLPADLGVKSIPRNPLLFGILYRMEAVEHIGSGIKRIRNLCREYGVTEPCLEVSEHWFTVIFPRPSATNTEKQQPELRPESQPESMTVQILTSLEGGPLSKSEISNRLGQKSVSGHLNKVMRTLLADKLVEYTIPEKPTSRLQKYCLTVNGRQHLEQIQRKRP